MWSISIGTAGLILVLISASINDMRSREIPDIHWVAGGSLAILMSVIGASSQGILAAAEVMAGSSILLAYMVCDRVPGAVAVPVSALCYLAASSADAVYLSVSATVVSLLGMYRLGLIRGGADAKALLVIAMAYPAYPQLDGLPLIWEPSVPMSYVFNPAVSVLVLSLFLSLLPVFPIAARNVCEGRTGKGMFSTQTLPLDEARRRFVWPVEDAVGGRKVAIPVGCEDPGVYDRLEEAGYGEVAVTPIIPFIVPMTVSFAAVILLGSPLFVLMA